MAEPFLPYGRQTIEDDDVAAVAAALHDEYLTTGPRVERFERAFAEAVSAPHALACSSGTAALHLAATALGLGPGDAAVVPAVTFLATANVVRLLGAELLFADVDPRTGLTGPEEIAAALTQAGRLRPRAIFAVHLNGQSADMPGIGALARRFGLAVVEDACHALGARQRRGDGDWSPVGACSEGDLTAFSLHPVKAIAMGEGGVVTTRDPGLATSVARLRSHGMVRTPEAFRNTDLAFDADGRPNPWYYEMNVPGFNYRASDIQCALALSQLGKLGRFIDRRRAIADLYDRLLAPLAPVVQPVPRVRWSEHAWHLYVIHIDFAGAGMSRARLMRELRERGIGTQVHYLPLHLQPYYRERYGPIDLPGALAYYRGCLSLPIFPTMGDTEVDRVVTALTDVLGKP